MGDATFDLQNESTRDEIQAGRTVTVLYQGEVLTGEARSTCHWGTELRGIGFWCPGLTPNRNDTVRVDAHNILKW